MEKQYVVALSITKKYEVRVKVVGEYAGSGDPQIEEDAISAAEFMDHGCWDYIDTEYVVDNVTLIGKG